MTAARKLDYSRLTAALHEITGDDTEAVIIIAATPKGRYVRAFGASKDVREAVEAAAKAVS